jgi:hypothetical protein
LEEVAGRTREKIDFFGGDNRGEDRRGEERE